MGFAHVFGHSRRVPLTLSVHFRHKNNDFRTVKHGSLQSGRAIVYLIAAIDAKTKPRLPEKLPIWNAQLKHPCSPGNPLTKVRLPPRVTSRTRIVPETASSTNSVAAQRYCFSTYPANVFVAVFVAVRCISWQIGLSSPLLAWQIAFCDPIGIQHNVSELRQRAAVADRGVRIDCDIIACENIACEGAVDPKRCRAAHLPENGTFQPCARTAID
jgi:hypothetical protein